MSTARLYAIVLMGNDWHSGQWSRGYRLLCMASQKLLRRGIARPIDQWDRKAQWPPPFRSHVARELQWLRHYRKDL